MVWSDMLSLVGPPFSGRGERRRDEAGIPHNDKISHVHCRHQALSLQNHGTF